MFHLLPLWMAVVSFTSTSAGTDASTNVLFKTVGSVSRDEYEEIALKRPSGKYTQEKLPAEKDPAGNWGPLTNGIQISARLYATNFAVGDPVPAVILWRNVGEKPMNFPLDSEENYRFDLYLQRNGEVLEPKLPHIRSGGYGSVSGGDVEPGTQYKETERLDEIFDLSVPGDYSFEAGRITPALKQWQKISARSGTARFVIYPKSEKKNSGSQTNSVVPNK